MSMDLYVQKVDEAKALVDAHNSQFESDEGKVSWEKFLSNLKAMGGTTDSALRACTWEDLQECGVPRILARNIADIFRASQKHESKAAPASGLTAGPVKLTRTAVDAMPFSDLLRYYDPTGETNGFVAERLRRESNDRRFLVFEEGGAVNVDVSLELLHNLRDNFAEREEVLIDEKPHRVYKVGELRDRTFDENFMFPGERLRGNFCDRTNRDVSKVPTEVRQIVYLAITDTKELSIKNASDAHDLLDKIAEASDPLSWAQRRFQRAALALRELKEEGDAPKLRLRHERTAPGAKHDPFGIQSRK